MHREFPAARILALLSDDDLLPCILFRTSRRQCDEDIERIGNNSRCELSKELQAELERELQAVVAKYRLDTDVVEAQPHYSTLLRCGVGAHHAGQLLLWRLVLEELMSRGLMRLLVATGTVAAGVDFPARTVVVTAHSKRGTEGFKVLSSSEFQQMSGRAGRRGKDNVGICVIAPGPFCDARVIHQVAKTPPEPLRSAYFAAPSTVLNLLKYRNAEDLRFTVSRSLAAFLDRKAAKALEEGAAQLEKEIEANPEIKGERRKKAEKRVRRRQREAQELSQKQLALLDTSLRGLTSLGHVNEGKLTEKGLWSAELCTSLVLELAEAIDQHVFLDCGIEEMVALVGSIAGDSYRTYFSLRKNPIKKEHYQAMQKCVDRVASLYQGSPFSSEVKVLPDAAVTVLTWLESESWSDFSGLLRLNGVTEGDAARLISQTADHLNQITRLSETHPDLARTALDARSLLLRPPVTDTQVAALTAEVTQTV